MFIWLKWPQVTIVLHFISFAHFKIYSPGSVFDLSSKPAWNFPPGKSFIGLQSSQEVVPLYVTYRVFSPSSGNNYCAIFWIENIIIFFLTRDMVIWQILVKESLDFLGGPTPLASLNGGNQEKLPPHDCLWPPLFILKSIPTIKIRMFTKKNIQKLFIFGQMASTFVQTTLLICWTSKWFKISYLAHFWNFFSKFLHVISYYTYQQVICNKGSNQILLL